MNRDERECLKSGLRNAISVQGIDLDTPDHWVVENIHELGAFFDSLDSLLPADATLYFEGAQIAPDVAMFYETHAAQNITAVALDTISPPPSVYHVTFSRDIVRHLRQLVANRSTSALGDHIKAYRCQTLLFTFHDAFSGKLRISGHVREPSVVEFCSKLGLSFYVEQTSCRDYEQLRLLAEALESQKQRPWWKRLLSR